MHRGYVHPRHVYGIRGGADAVPDAVPVSVKVVVNIKPHNRPATYLVVTNQLSDFKFVVDILQAVTPSILFVLTQAVSGDARIDAFKIDTKASQSQQVAHLKTRDELRATVVSLYAPTTDTVNTIVNFLTPPNLYEVEQYGEEVEQLMWPTLLFVDASGLVEKGFNQQLRAANVDLTDATEKVKALSRQMKRRCPMFDLQLRLLSDQPGQLSVYDLENEYIALCLYYQGDCIASVIGKQDRSDPYTLELRRVTNPAYEGRKLSKLLTAAWMQVAPRIRVKFGSQWYTIDTTLSLAVASNSAWLLLGTYQYNLERRNQALETQLSTLTTQASKIDAIKKHLKRKHQINISVPLDEQNIQTAESLFDQLVFDMFEMPGQVHCKDLTPPMPLPPPPPSPLPPFPPSPPRSPVPTLPLKQTSRRRRDREAPDEDEVPTRRQRLNDVFSSFIGRFT